jgi:hypothetical protein
MLVPVIAALPASAGTQVRVDSMNLDDLALRDVRCDLTGGGLFASLTVGAQLSSQSEPLNAYYPAGAAIRLSWSFARGQVADASVVESSQPSADAWMLSALSEIKSTLSGACSTTFLIGDLASDVAIDAPQAEPAVDPNPTLNISNAVVTGGHLEANPTGVPETAKLPMPEPHRVRTASP